MIGTIVGVLALIALVVFLGFGVRIVRQTHKGCVERFGKFNRICGPGLHIIIPIVEVMHFRNMTERIADVQPQDIITKDNLNATVDLQVYYKVVDTKEAIVKSYYNVDDFKVQIIFLAQTTARNVIGDMKFAEVNGQRNELNRKLAESISNEIENWGVSVVRVELKEIKPPKDVQETMNRVIKAQNEKDSAVDSATAIETQADGVRRAKIKEAEGVKQAAILAAQGQAEAIQLVNEAAEKYFKGSAVELKKLETVQVSLQNNAKIIITKDGINPTLLIGNLSEVTPS